jgi:hypothetical protein
MSPKKNRQTTWVTLFVAIGSIGYGRFWSSSRKEGGLEAYFEILGYAASIIGQVLGQPQFFESFNLAQEGPGLGYTNAIIGKPQTLFVASKNCAQT